MTRRRVPKAKLGSERLCRRVSYHQYQPNEAVLMRLRERVVETLTQLYDKAQRPKTNLERGVSMM
jgi:hypothetical protein